MKIPRLPYGCTFPDVPWEKAIPMVAASTTPSIEDSCTSEYCGDENDAKDAVLRCGYI
jgi:hypothetical protein